MVGRIRGKYWRVFVLCGLVLSGSVVGVSEVRLFASTGALESSSLPVAGIVATPELVTLIDVPVGDTYTQEVRLLNEGEATLQIKRIAVSNADIQVTGVMVPVVVAHGTSQAFTISYRPKAEQRINGEVRIYTNVDEAPFVVKVRASSNAVQAELTASAASLAFEDVATGSTSRKELSLRNTGNREVRLGGISASGGDFSSSDAGAVSLAPGQEISLGVNFTPKGGGRQTGSLRIRNASGGSLLEIPLVANGASTSQSTVKLNWEASPVSVAGYAIYRAADPTGPYTRISSVPSAEFIDTGLAAGHTYYYVVTALNPDDTESEYSEPISATVPSV